MKFISTRGNAERVDSAYAIKTGLAKDGGPASAVTPEKQRGIITAAKCYLGFNRPDTRARLDVIEVLVKNGGKRRRVVEIKHLKGAFNLNTAHRRK